MSVCLLHSFRLITCQKLKKHNQIKVPQFQSISFLFEYLFIKIMFYLFVFDNSQ